MPPGFTPERDAAHWSRACGLLTPRLALTMPGQVYRKLGTSVETQLMVFDKVQEEIEIVRAMVDDLDEALPLSMPWPQPVPRCPPNGWQRSLMVGRQFHHLPGARPPPRRSLPPKAAPTPPSRSPSRASMSRATTGPSRKSMRDTARSVSRSRGHRSIPRRWSKASPWPLGPPCLRHGQCGTAPARQTDRGGTSLRGAARDHHHGP